MTTQGKLRIATVVYWVLLLYIIAALGWWAFSLLKQNGEIHALKRSALAAASPSYSSDQKQIETSQKRNVYKYIGEGSAFLFLILVGAFYIYRSVRRQFRLQQQQQNFVMAITHELKTPIAVSRLNLETLQKRKLEEEQKQKLLQMTMQETVRLETLINNILIASQLEEGGRRTAKEDLNFSDLVSDVARAFAARYPERPLDISVQDNVEIFGEAALLKLLLSNLLENANKYSPKAKPIAVSLVADEHFWDKEAIEVWLTVSDEGTGIPNEEKKTVFKKFYRVGNEQTRKTQGTGLGLYLCKKIVEDHGGKISVQDNQPAGSTFTVQF